MALAADLEIESLVLPAIGSLLCAYGWFSVSTQLPVLAAMPPVLMDS